MKLDFADNLYKPALRIDRVALAVAFAILFLIGVSDALGVAP